ncbi:MAG: BrnT family toxin [Thermodesulfobacteriota bacterium]|nr:BrnT family toxin [Thermodesulfobacteriota bacterium]
MEFEFDNRKSKNNKKKHGIDFFEAQALWDDPDRIVIPAKTIDEPRCIVIGQINQKSWSAIVTYRNDKIRIISVRRARMEEVEIYES